MYLLLILAVTNSEKFRECLVDDAARTCSRLRRGVVFVRGGLGLTHAALLQLLLTVKRGPCVVKVVDQNEFC